MKVKAQPFSVRLSPRLDARIAALARQTRRSKGAVLQSLADEAERCQRYPGIGFRDEGVNRRPWVIGTGLDVWEAICLLQDYGNDAEAAGRDFPVTVEQFQLASAYYAEFPEEIDEALAANRRSIEELRREYPFIQVVTVPD